MTQIGTSILPSTPKSKNHFFSTTSFVETDIAFYDKNVGALGEICPPRHVCYGRLRLNCVTCQLISRIKTVAILSFPPTFG